MLIFSSLTRAEVLQYHPNSPAYIGGNFDPTYPGRAYPECLIRTTVRSESILPGQIPGTPTATQFFIRKVSSRRELYRLLNVSLSMSGSYGLFSADFSGSLEQENNFSEESFTWVMQGYSNFGKFVLEAVALTPEAKALSGDPVAFRRRCGTDYVAMEVRAVQAAAVFTIKNLSESERKVLESSFSASYGGGGPLSIGGDAKYAEFVKKAAQYGQIEVNVYAIGGEGVAALSPIITSIEKPDETLKTLQDYFTGLNLSRSAAVSYNTGSLQSLINAKTIEADIYNRFIADIFVYYEEVRAERKRLANIMRYSGDWGVSTKQAEDISAEVYSLEQEENNVLVLANNCRAAFNDVGTSNEQRKSACKLPTGKSLELKRKFVGLQPKPYWIRYFVTNELIPGEELINFTVRGHALQNVSLVKKLSVADQTFAPINSVQVKTAADGSKEAGTTLVMKDILDAELPVGLRIELESGKFYFEPFAFTRATIAIAAFDQETTAAQKTVTSAIAGPKTTKEANQKAYSIGDFLPGEWKETD